MFKYSIGSICHKFVNNKRYTKLISFIKFSPVVGDGQVVTHIFCSCRPP